MKKIDHLCSNFNIDKFLELIPTCKDFRASDFAELIIKCIDDYNDKDDEDELFIEYLEHLLKTGEFFIKLKKYFHIEEYFSSVVVEETLWNEAFVLFCIKDKKYRLFITNYGSVTTNDSIHIIDTTDKYDLKISLIELNKFNKQYHDIDKKNGKSEFNLNAPDFEISKPHTSDEDYYNSHHKEALMMEHKDIKLNK